MSQQNEPLSAHAFPAERTQREIFPMGDDADERRLVKYIGQVRSIEKVRRSEEVRACGENRPNNRSA